MILDQWDFIQTIQCKRPTKCLYDTHMCQLFGEFLCSFSHVKIKWCAVTSVTAICSVKATSDVVHPIGMNDWTISSLQASPKSCSNCRSALEIVNTNHLWIQSMHAERNRVCVVTERWWRENREQERGGRASARGGEKTSVSHSITHPLMYSGCR